MMMSGTRRKKKKQVVTSDTSRLYFFELLSAVWGLSWILWSNLGGTLGSSWAVLGLYWAILGPSWTSKGPLRPSWVPLEALRGHLGPLVRRSGAISEASWVVLSRRMPEKARMPQPFQNVRATNDFGLFGPFCDTSARHGTCETFRPSADWGFSLV